MLTVWRTAQITHLLHKRDCNVGHPAIAIFWQLAETLTSCQQRAVAGQEMHGLQGCKAVQLLPSWANHCD